MGKARSARVMPWHLNVDQPSSSAAALRLLVEVCLLSPLSRSLRKDDNITLTVASCCVYELAL
jgi:dolichol kinase